ncbi:MAG TPA: DUF6220 domain-containing protein [Actinomycetes bacterium]|nr:DUF6220 domain-containing protein [Actinomycetes bacterium]
MRTAYRVLAIIIAIEVAIQAAAMAFAVAGLGIWIDKDGGVLDKATFEAEPDFTGAVGFMIHGMNGMMIIPLIALILLIVSFFAKIPGGVARAAIVFGLVVLQVLLGLFGHENAYLGLLHGLNALAIFGSSIGAAMLARSSAASGETVRT